MSLDRDSLLKYLETSAGVPVADIEDETLLFSNGILDSFSMMDLIMFIENEGGFRIQPDEVTFENLDSIERILRFSDAKLEA